MTAPVRYVVLDLRTEGCGVFSDVATAHAHAATLDLDYPHDAPHTVHALGPAIPAPGPERWERVTRWAVRRGDAWFGANYIDKSKADRTLFATQTSAQIVADVFDGAEIKAVPFRRRVKP